MAPTLSAVEERRARACRLLHDGNREPSLALAAASVAAGSAYAPMRSLPWQSPAASVTPQPAAVNNAPLVHPFVYCPLCGALRSGRMMAKGQMLESRSLGHGLGDRAKPACMLCRHLHACTWRP